MKKIGLLTFLLFCMYSCNWNNRIKCEGFDFKRIPYKKAYFFNSLHYSNGNDTIRLRCVWHKFSKPSSYDESAAFLTECRPDFIISYRDKENKLNLEYIFSYSPLEENIMELSLFVNSSYRSFLLPEIKGNREYSFNLGRKYNLTANISDEEIIDRIKIQKYRITYIEMGSDETWKLIRIGDSLLRSNS